MKQIILLLFVITSLPMYGQKWHHHLYGGLNLGTLTEIAFEKEIYVNPYPNQEYMGLLLGGQLGYEIEYRPRPSYSISSGLSLFNFGKNTKLYALNPFPTGRIIRERSWLVNLGCPILFNYYPFKNDKVSVSGGYILSRALGGISDVNIFKRYYFAIYYDRGFHHSIYFGLNLKLNKRLSTSIFWFQSLGEYLDDPDSHTLVVDYMNKLIEYDMSYRSTNYGLSLKYTIR